MNKKQIAITYTIKKGGAAKGFLEFLKARENLKSISIITCDWEYSRKNYFRSRANALLSRILQFVLFKKYVKCSLNYYPVVDLSKFDHTKIYLGWVGNGMINFENNPLAEYVVRFSDEWWLSDIQHYKLNQKLCFPSILERKISFLNKKNVTIVFPSIWLKQSFIDILGGKKLECQTSVIRNVASNDFFNHPKGNIRRLYFVASKLSDPNKGFDILKDNLNLLNLYFDEIFVIGSHRGVKNVNGLHFLGHLNAEDLASRYKEGGVYLHLARRDNSPNSLIEACSSGLIPIVMGGSGAQEYVEDVDFKVPLILNPDDNLRVQIDKILSELDSCAHQELEDLALEVQKNIRRMC